MITPRGFGVIPDRVEDTELDGRLRHVSGLVGANPTFAPTSDWTHLLDAVQDQGRTNRCVAYSFATAMYLAGQACGRPIPRPSAKWLYDIARYHDTPGVLVDIGSRARSMALAAGRHGVISEARLVTTEANVNEPPPFDADLAAADAFFTGYYKADGHFPTLVRMGLDQGHFASFTIVVHESFLNIKPGEVYEEPEGDEHGRHMVVAIAHRPREVLIANSWGTSWGDGGFCWMSDRFLASQYVADRYVVTAAPRVT